MSNVTTPASAVAPAEGPLHYFRSHPGIAASILLILVFALIALLAPWIAPHDPLAQSFLKINASPSAEHLLGTDQFGRDILSRLIYGSRNSLIFGLIPPVLAAIIGTFVGICAAYFGGWLDRIVAKLIDMLQAFPDLLLAIMISAVLGGGFWNVVGVITVAFIPGFTRVARASALAIKQEPFIEAGKAIGVGTPTIIFRHIMLNISAPVIVLVTLWVASAIRIEASLSFLGLGTQAPNPSWGNIIRDGLNNIFGSPWPVIGAGAAITLVVLAFNVVGEAVRDILDPSTVD